MAEIEEKVIYLSEYFSGSVSVATCEETIEIVDIELSDGTIFTAEAVENFAENYIQNVLRAELA